MQTHDRVYFCAYWFETPQGDLDWEASTGEHPDAAGAISEAAAFLTDHPGVYDYAELGVTHDPQGDPWEDWLGITVRPRHKKED